MKILRSATATALSLGTGIWLASATAAAQAQTPANAATQTGAVVTATVVEPEALAALRRMSAYLMTLNTFALKIDSVLDVVTNEGQRIQIDSVIRYKVKRPGFVIETDNDLKSRRYYYDGKQFSVVAPKLGFYATVPAPPTNREMLDELHDKYGVKIPLEDLFRWNDPDEKRSPELLSGFAVGTATIDGVPTDHYAFRQANLDWEVWIERGQRPIPRKFAIVDRTDSAQPGYTAFLSWTVNPTLAASDFVFEPTKDDHRIGMGTLEFADAPSGVASEK
jgi:hypothetical protein